MPRSWIVYACVGLVLAAWLIDMFTPQLFVAAILFDAPVALTALALNRRFTWTIVGLCLVFNAIAGWYNGLHEGVYYPIATLDRVLAGLSTVLVGGLAVATQGAARFAGESAERDAVAKRANALRRAGERMRESLSLELVWREVVRQAVALLDSDAATLFPCDNGRLSENSFVAMHDSDDVEARNERPGPGVWTALQKALAERGIVYLNQADALARFTLGNIGAQSALIAPLGSGPDAVAVLLVEWRQHERQFDRELENLVQAFADQSARAIEQAKLVEALAATNDQLQSANRELLERNQVIRDLVYALSHDLRTPLMAGSMTMRQALAGAYGRLPAEYVEVLRRSLQSNEELERLAQTLLLVARYESREESKQRRPADLGALARSVVAELESLWRSKHIECRVEGEGVFGLVDESEMRRALINLIANAVTWTPEGGKILVRVSQSDGTAQVDVEDDGFGVPAQERSALFQRFFGDGMARRGGGTGLGLYIVRRIAESHGGSVTYQPRQPRGSVFTLRVPSAVPAEAPHA
ncbi:MAG: HAMP domain-containing histidine kinase [Candidatus Eremiobacteraeota bacterium]|nr:HAMP domain-containing histidine kinase [Candidatus Eremiobacteraeota bacterium]MBV8365206.1 HAMP domain-containing histidine kinase [Candidatus Eremiobacteraeota bacterium]